MDLAVVLTVSVTYAVVFFVLFCAVLPGTEGMPEYRDWRFHYQVLIPRPVPWPLLLIPAYL